LNKKITITLDESILLKLDNEAQNQGKDKNQIIEEALTSHLNITSKEEKAKQWYEENKEAVDEYNKKIEKEGLILAEYRSF